MGIAFTTIRIGNLSLANVTSLIAEALGMEDDKDAVQPLAVIVHKKTDGNAFFVLMFLRSLHNEQLLQFNIGAYKWTWDMEAVEAKLATENVATMLVDKLKRLDKKTQRVLKVASCLGSKFSLSGTKNQLNCTHIMVIRHILKNVSPTFLKSGLPKPWQ